jgi:quinoprotein glucose dehydrogenase
MTSEPKLRRRRAPCGPKLDPAAAVGPPELLADEKVRRREAGVAILAALILRRRGQAVGEWLDQERRQGARIAHFDIPTPPKFANTPKALFARSPKVENAAGHQIANDPKGDKLAHFESLEGVTGTRHLPQQPVYASGAKLDNRVGWSVRDEQPSADKEKDRVTYRIHRAANAKIAKGYETVVLTLADERVSAASQGELKGGEARHGRSEGTDDPGGRHHRPPHRAAMPDDLHRSYARTPRCGQFLSSLKEPPKK